LLFLFLFKWCYRWLCCCWKWDKQ